MIATSAETRRSATSTSRHSAARLPTARPTAPDHDEVDRAIADATPAIVRGAGEHRFVRRECIDDAVRQSAAVGLLTLPLVAVVALAFASADAGRHLILWIGAGLVSELLVIAALFRSRAAQQADRPEDALGLQLVAFASVGAVWGATTFVIDWTDPSRVSAFVMFPFTVAVLAMVQAAPLRSLFRSSQITLVGVGVAGLLVQHSPHTIVIACFAVAWYAVAEALHHSLHSAVLRGHQMRWRADELVVHLRAERLRLAEANGQLAEQAVHDSLTGLLNRPRRDGGTRQRSRRPFRERQRRCPVHRPRPVQERQRQPRPSGG